MIPRIWRDKRGNFSLMFAFCCIPVLAAVGMVIDYNRALTTKSKLQHAVDAAVLAAGAIAATAEEVEIIATAEQIFNANFEPPAGSSGASVNTVVDDGKITVSAATSVGTSMLKLVNLNQLAIQVHAEAMPPQVANGEIVMVLDYSWSMTDTAAGGGGVKWQTMRDAAKQLVATLGQNGANTNVKFAIVPFSEYVRLSMPKEYVLGQTGSGTWTGCTRDRKYPYNIESSTPTSSDITKFRQCGWGWSGGSYTCHQASTSTCLQYAATNVAVMDLTNDHQAIQDRLDGMYPIGYTHISLGLEIGYHVISPNAPYTSAQPFGTEGLVKAIVLLTDGAQTSEAWGPADAHSVSQGETNLEALCSAVKANDTMLITVAFDLNDAATVNRLQNCATAPAYAFDANSGQALSDAFVQITGQLATKLHLSQ